MSTNLNWNCWYLWWKTNTKEKNTKIMIFLCLVYWKKIKRKESKINIFFFFSSSILSSIQFFFPQPKQAFAGEKKCLLISQFIIFESAIDTPTYNWRIPLVTHIFLSAFTADSCAFFSQILSWDFFPSHLLFPPQMYYMISFLLIQRF